MGLVKTNRCDGNGASDGRKVPRLTTLCYIERDGCWLVIHRNKKQNDENGDKWIGVGGKFEYGESPVECAMREVKEETGLTMLNPRFRGLVTFVSDEWGVEYMHLFTCDKFAGELAECDEGDLVWLPKAELFKKKLWEGDKIFLRALEEREDFFSLRLRYAGEVLVEHAFE
jgi:8-oxo-dGTP diphosphatase